MKQPPPHTPRTSSERAHVGRTERVKRNAARRTKMRMLLGAVVACIFLGLLFAFGYASWQPFAQLRPIEVSGGGLVPNETLRAFSENFIRDSMVGISTHTLATVRTHALASALKEQYAALDTVTISRAWLRNTITVHVQEYDRAALWCAYGNDGCMYMSHSGYVFAPAPNDATLTRWHGGTEQHEPLRSTIHETHIRDEMRIVRELISLNIPVHDVEIHEDEREMRLFVDHWYVRTLIGDTPEAVVRYVRGAVESKEVRDIRENLEYIDARFGNRIFYKERSPSEGDTGSVQEATEE